MTRNAALQYRSGMTQTNGKAAAKGQITLRFTEKDRALIAFLKQLWKTDSNIAIVRKAMQQAAGIQ